VEDLEGRLLLDSAAIAKPVALTMDIDFTLSLKPLRAGTSEIGDRTLAHSHVLAVARDRTPLDSAVARTGPVIRAIARYRSDQVDATTIKRATSLARQQRVKTDAASTKPRSLEQLVALARRDAGSRASKPRIVEALLDLIDTHIGFNLYHSNFGDNPVTSGNLKRVLNYWDVPDSSDPTKLFGFDCVTLTSFAMLALQSTHFPGSIAVKTFIPSLSPYSPTTAVVGSLVTLIDGSYQGIPNPDNPSEFLQLFDYSGGANSFEAALVYTFKGGTYYFPGGVYQTDGVNLVYSNPDDLLTDFQSLGWAYSTPSGVVEDPYNVLYFYPGVAPSTTLPGHQ